MIDDDDDDDDDDGDDDDEDDDGDVDVDDGGDDDDDTSEVSSETQVRQRRKWAVLRVARATVACTWHPIWRSNWHIFCE